MTSETVNSPNQARLEAKQALRQTLASHGGDPNHGAVSAAIDALVALNPTPSPTCQSDLWEGDWLLISAPSFPHGERQQDGTYAYTLGRLAFNMFQPKHLQVRINRVSQPIWPIEKTGRCTHDIVVEFQTLSDDFPLLTGFVRNLGVCEPKNDTALQVQFTGGVLEPKADTDLQIWNQAFGPQTTMLRPSLKEWGQDLFLKLMFGLVPPAGIDAATGRSEFGMKRSPKGSLEILYLDKELRITQGEKGTVLVCERL